MDSIAHGPTLVAIARESIEERLGVGARAARTNEWLRQIAATFVTLRKHGELRGCIGTVDARSALGEDIVHNSQAAAFHDPRFPPLERSELGDIEVEVSLLSQRRAMEAASEMEALARLRPGVDGVHLEFGEARATFLPQVWESIPDPLAFLCELRRKADLPLRFWHPELKLTRYTVEKFRDERPGA